MAVSPDMTFQAGDVVTFQGTVRWNHRSNEDTVAVSNGHGSAFFVPREAIISVRPVIGKGDLVEHTTSGREGFVRHVHDGLAWVAWSGLEENTVMPVADLMRRRTALEMAAVAEPAPLPAVTASSDHGDTGPSPSDEGIFG